jgi:DNA-binding response OmpR family regulator
LATRRRIPEPERGAIIVAERDRHMADLVSQFLSEAGYTCVCLRDGYEALDRARSTTPGLIVTEILVPRLNGLALCRLIKGDPALIKTKVLVFSELEAQARALQAGADAFIVKPLEKSEFLDIVRKLTSARETKS